MYGTGFENKCVDVIKARIWKESILDYLTLHPKTSVLSDASEEGRTPQSLYRKHDTADTMTWTSGFWNG